MLLVLILILIILTLKDDDNNVYGYDDGHLRGALFIYY